MKEKGFSFTDRLRSFGYAFKGIKYLVEEQHNSWIHLCMLLCVTIAGFAFDISSSEWLVCVLCFGIVLAAEAFNSAIEVLADRITRENDPEIGKAKDLAAAAVLLSALGAATAGIIIFIPKLWHILCA